MRSQFGAEPRAGSGHQAGAMRDEWWVRALWVGSLLLAMVGGTWLLLRVGVEWGAGAAP